MAAKKLNKKVVKKAAPSTKGVVSRLVAAPASSPLAVVKRSPITQLGPKAGTGTLTQNQRLAHAKSVMTKINHTFKSEVVTTADNMHSNAWLRRPSGIMQLDIDSGGGLPAGTFNTLTGPDGSGKTTLLYSYFAMHQRLFGADSFCAIDTTEGGIDYFQARRCGWIIPVPSEVIAARQRELKLRGMPSLTEEDVAELRREVGHNAIIQGLSTAEENLDVLETMLASNVYGLVGLDSYEGLMPKSEASLDSLEEFPVQAARASLIGRFLQHYGPITRNPSNFTTFIMTCQVRYNRAKAQAPAHFAKYMKDWAGVVPPSVKHWRQLDIQVWSGAKISNGKKEDEKESIGKMTNWEITKGKLGAHDHINGDTPYFYDPRGFDPLRTVLTSGLRYGVIKEDEGELTFFRCGTAHDFLDRVPSADEFVHAMRENPDVELEVRREILAAAGKQCSYI